MTAIAWSLVGLMAASLGVLASALFSSLSGFASVNARIDTVGAETRNEIRELRVAIQTLDQRLTRAGG